MVARSLRDGWINVSFLICGSEKNIGSEYFDSLILFPYGSDHCYTIISKIYDSRGGELSIKGKKER